MKYNIDSTVAASTQKLQELLQAAHAVVRTFNVENTTKDIALEPPAIVTMLHGVDALLDMAATTALEMPFETAKSEWKAHNNLPESWMFEHPPSGAINVNVVDTACCRARALIKLMIATGGPNGWPDLLHEHDQIHSIWAIEGIIAQAIAAVTVGSNMDSSGNRANHTQVAA